MIPDFAKPKFEIGNTRLSPKISKLAKTVLLVELYLDRHQLGDWDNSEEDTQALNKSAIETNDLVISRFNTTFGLIKVMTNKDRNKTIVLFENEYPPDI
jgi:hypothetical protein